MTPKEAATKFIDDEIEWCVKNMNMSSANLTPDYQRGFIEGLKQAKRLLTLKKLE